MATPIVYGEANLVNANGKKKLTVNVSSKLNIAITKFTGDEQVYAQVSARGKTLSLGMFELEELTTLLDAIKGKCTPARRCK